MSGILTVGTGVLISILSIFFLAYMVMRGWHNGIVHSLVGILVFVAAFAIANKLSVSYAPQFQKAIEPMITGIVDDASMKAIGQKARTIKDENGEKVELPIEVPEEYDGSVYMACVLSFREIGFDRQLTERLAHEIAEDQTEVDARMREKITAKTAAVVAFVLVFVMICALILIAAGALINLFNLNIHFPGYELLSRIGGAAMSFFLGLLVIYGVCWILRFLGAIVPENFNSGILNLFLKNNPLENITQY